MAQRWGFKSSVGLVILGLGAASCATVVVTDKDDPVGDDGSGGASTTDASSATASSSSAASSSSSSSSGGGTVESETFFNVNVYPTVVSCTACHAAPGVGSAPIFLAKDAPGSYKLIKTKPSIYAPQSKSSIFTIGTAGKPHTGGPISENIKSAFAKWLALEFPM